MRSAPLLFWQKLTTPVGDWWAGVRPPAGTDGETLAVFRSTPPAEPADFTSRPLHDEIARQVRDFFARSRTDFDLPLSPDGTGFQQAVWRQLCVIPYGSTLSYGDLARRLDNPGAMRAVGQANNANPIALIIPCHRVIGADGSLTGFGGGISLKKRLLEFESPPRQNDLFAC